MRSDQEDSCRPRRAAETTSKHLSEKATQEFSGLVACLPVPREARQLVYQAIGKIMRLFTICYRSHQFEGQCHIATTLLVLLPGPLKGTNNLPLQLLPAS